MMEIYLTCNMNARESASLKAPVLKVIPKGSKLEVLDINDFVDGYQWFVTDVGYIANVPEVYCHIDDYIAYRSTNKIKDYVKSFLIDSLESTQKATEEIIKALDNF